MTSIILYFDGTSDNHTGSLDHLTGVMYKYMLKDYEFYHVETPLKYSLKYLSKQINRIDLEFDALYDISIVDYLISTIIPFTKAYDTVYLFGMSLGASNILSIIRRMYERNDPEITELLTKRKIRLITTQCDIFYPSKIEEGSMDGLVEWKNGDTYFWLDPNKHVGLFNWITEHFSWHHVYSQYCEYNYPVKMEKYTSIMCFLKVDENIVDYRIELLNHSLMFNVEIFAVVKMIINDTDLSKYELSSEKHIEFLMENDLRNYRCI